MQGGSFFFLRCLDPVAILGVERGEVRGGEASSPQLQGREVWGLVGVLFLGARRGFCCSLDVFCLVGGAVLMNHVADRTQRPGGLFSRQNATRKTGPGLRVGQYGKSGALIVNLLENVGISVWWLEMQGGVGVAKAGSWR
jgi:hypothetical protein